jgi:hypothetical protein
MAIVVSFLSPTPLQGEDSIDMEELHDAIFSLSRSGALSKTSRE